MTGDPPSIAAQFGKQSAAVAAPPAGTVRQLAAECATAFSLDPHTVKLLLPGRGMLRHDDGRTLAEAGVQPGMRVKVMGSHAGAVASVAAAEARSRDERRPGLDAELRRDLRRAGLADGPGGGSAHPPQGPYTFHRYEAWQHPGLRPPPSEALKLLHRLAADPGIVGVMNKHRWTVGLLSEMPPAGKVGISPVCILGVNINAGQEVSLRLRTDDLKGFRRYDRIRETLLHELAHMVHSEHDTAFKTLNSQLRRECDEADWRGAAARSLAGPAFEGSVDYDLPPERQTTMQQTAATSGQTLRQMGGGGGAAPADARQAAAEAALRRSGAAGGVAQAPVGVAAQQQQQQQFRKGDRVLYRQRDGSLVEATVAAVDLSVQPPSYGIDLPTGYRETEASRLAPVPPAGQEQQQAEEVEGLGHRDAATEAKEAAVAELER